MLHHYLNKKISRWKDQTYKIDPGVPTIYLLELCFIRFSMLLRGSISGIKHKGKLFISSSAKIRSRSKIQLGKTVTFSSKCYIDALSQYGLTFGDNVSVGKNTTIEATGNLQHLGKGMIVGNNVGLGNDNFFGCAGGIEIGNDTIIGNYVSFHSENHRFEDLTIPIRLQGVHHRGIKVGDNCWIGAKSTILDGAQIENGCVIAAGSLVVAGVYKPNAVYGGVPAKFLKYRNND